MCVAKIHTLGYLVSSLPYERVELLPEPMDNGTSTTDTIRYAMISVPFDNPLSEKPIFGSTEFIGRTRLAQNLFSRCLRGQSILLYGGPKLGKTSMLLHLKWLVDRDREASTATPAA